MPIAVITRFTKQIYIYNNNDNNNDDNNNNDNSNSNNDNNNNDVDDDESFVTRILLSIRFSSRAEVIIILGHLELE